MEHIHEEFLYLVWFFLVGIFLVFLSFLYTRYKDKKERKKNLDYSLSTCIKRLIVSLVSDSARLCNIYKCDDLYIYELYTNTTAVVVDKTATFEVFGTDVNFIYNSDGILVSDIYDTIKNGLHIENDLSAFIVDKY